MARKRADYKRGAACARVIRDNLDMSNPEWIGNLTEWCALDAIAERIEMLERYNSSVNMGGRIVSAWEYFETVKDLKYSPALQRIYEGAMNKVIYRATMNKRPLPNVVECPLLEGVYNLAVNQRQRPGSATGGGKFDGVKNRIVYAENEIGAGKQGKKAAARQSRRGGKPCKQGKRAAAGRAASFKE